MKKPLKIIMPFILLIVSCTCVSADCRGFDVNSGFAIEFNGAITDYSSVICNDTHYIPMRPIFEKMGAYVFYRSSDRQILALSRDGDIIRHIVETNIVTVNDEQKVFEYPSVLENGQTYIPIDMLAAAFCPDKISYENLTLHIQKPFFTNEYHKVIRDVLDICTNCSFYPERFQRYINFHAAMPDYDIGEVVFRVNLGLDYPFYENVSTIEHPYELLVLVNKYHKLPTNFNQYNLVDMGKEYTINDGKRYLLAGTAYDKYVQMAEAAKQEGLSIKVVSAYRTEDYQNGLYSTKVKKTGTVNADNYSARPGFSEHQTGLAVDINSTSGVFEYTPEFKWLQNHAHEYGYILRYQKGKEWITGYASEPWHYRFVGTDAAKVIHEENITYEEYYAKYVSVNDFR